MKKGWFLIVIVCLCAQIGFGQKEVVSFGKNGVHTDGLLTFYDDSTYQIKSRNVGCEGKDEETIILGVYEKRNQEITITAKKLTIYEISGSLKKVLIDSVLDSEIAVKYLYIEYEEAKILVKSEDYKIANRFVFNDLKMLLGKIDWFGATIPSRYWQSGTKNVRLKKNIKQKLPKSYQAYVPN